MSTRTGLAVVLPIVTIAIGVVIGLMDRMGKEDELMKQQFGEEWKKWAKTVPYKLIPLIL